MHLHRKADFNVSSLNRAQCCLVNRPKLPEEEYVVGTSAEYDGATGEIQLSIQACLEIGQFVGMLHPDETEALKAQVASLEDELELERKRNQERDEEAANLKSVVRQLAADLNTAEAVKQDAVAQFNEADASRKELEGQVSLLDERNQELSEALETAESLLEEAGE